MTTFTVALSIALLATGIVGACRYLICDHCDSCDAALTDPDDEPTRCWRCSRYQRIEAKGLTTDWQRDL